MNPSKELNQETEQRRLASVQTISFLSNIPGKDHIFLATVLGYQVIVNDTIFPTLRTGPTLCIFFEPDTVLDNENPGNDHLAKSKFRVRTIKIGGVYSEGFATSLTHTLYYKIDPTELKENQDLTTELKCIKYLTKDEIKDRNIPSNNKGYHYKNENPYLGPFPVDLIPRTDEHHLKSYPVMLERLKNRKVIITEKYDGMSATYYNGRLFSRNYEHLAVSQDLQGLQTVPEYKKSEYLTIAKKYNLLAYKSDYAIQGEIVGPGCNGNKLGLAGLDFYVFNIYDTVNKRYLLFDEVTALCTLLGLKTVPVIPNPDELTKDSLISLAESKLYDNGFPSEGIVVKTDDDKGPRISFKVVSRVYLDKIK